MEKLIYALTCPDGLTRDSFFASLLGEVTAAVRVAGARGIQVNVADEVVAAANQRRPPGGDSVDAMVSLWVDSARDVARAGVEGPLAASTSKLSGWLVTESVPIVPPATSAGLRTDGLANIAFISRPDQMPYADWLDRWQNQHTAVAIDAQSTFGYIQNIVVRTLTPETFQVDGVVEELFPLQACDDPHVWFGTGGDTTELERRVEAMGRSVDNFLERRNIGIVPTSRYVFSSPFA